MKSTAIAFSLVGVASFAVSFGGCVNPYPTSGPRNAEVTSTPSQRAASSPSVASTNPAFQFSAVCTLPKQVAAGTEFAQLGGGSWSRWIEEGDLDHSCNGGTDEIKLKKTSDGEVIAEYQVFGSNDRVNFVGLQYNALQYLGPTQDEKALRQSFAEFCNQLAKRMFGKDLSNTFTNKLLNEATYYPTGKANEYGEKIGTGYVNLSSNRNNTLMYLLNVKFFPSESDYQRFKNS